MNNFFDHKITNLWRERTKKTLLKALELYSKYRPKKTFWTIANIYFGFILGRLLNNAPKLVQFLSEQYENSDNAFSAFCWGALKFWVGLDYPLWISIIISIIFIPLLIAFIIEKKGLTDSKEIDKRLNDVENEIYALKNNIEFRLSTDWIVQRNEEAITNLGPRYTPELNFELDISKMFDGLQVNSVFIERFKSKMHSLLVSGYDIARTYKLEDGEDKNLIESLNELKENFKNITFSSEKSLDFSSTKTLVDNISITVNKILTNYYAEEQKLNKKHGTVGYYHNFGFEIQSTRKQYHSCRSFIDYLDSSEVILTGKQNLILTGDAGIGKSHLVGDIVNKNKEHSLLILGQHLTSEQSPWMQILEVLGIDTTREKFLEAINSRAKENNKRFIIYLDAINEGKGQLIWPEHILGFLNSVKNYPYIRLVVSLRSSYKPLILATHHEHVEKEHHGFGNDTYEATEFFFKNYEIDSPNIPLLNTEFANPLFLKLFCQSFRNEGLSKTALSTHSITSVFEMFIGNLNKRLSKPTKYCFNSTAINLVQESIDGLIREMVNINTRYLPYNIAYKVVQSIVSVYTDKKGFLDDLVSEGVLTKNLFHIKGREFIEGYYIAYERLEDYLIANVLIKDIDDIQKSTEPNGELWYIFENSHTIQRNSGVLEALSILVPQKYGIEIFKLNKTAFDNFTIARAFIKSLVWRRGDSIKEISSKYINKVIMPNESLKDYYFDTLFTICSIPDHPYNSYHLHAKLLSLDMADRDAGWTIFINDKFESNNSLKRIIEWGWRNKDRSNLSNESVELLGIQLSWFLSSSNRTLRDSCTKSLVCLFTNRLVVLQEVLIHFEGVNDPYIYERLYAVCLGSSLRSSDHVGLKELCLYIYEIIFNTKGEVYPHILLRDYAKSLLEYVIKLGIDLKIGLADIQPQYNSTMPSKALTNDEIDEKYSIDHKSEGFERYMSPQNSILSSMTTEYGRGTSGYGDFGRYTFQSSLKDWDVNSDELSNIVVQWIFDKYGYDVKKHGSHDLNVDPFRRNNFIERIGKKYQWIGFYEMLARVSDNCKRYEGYGTRKHEIAYQGAFDPYVRDIDPTIIIKETHDYNDETSYISIFNSLGSHNFEGEDSEWIRKRSDLPTISDLIEIIDEEGTTWVVLDGVMNVSQETQIGEDKYDFPRKRLAVEFLSCIVKKNEEQKLFDWAQSDLMKKNWMQGGASRYELFHREYYWSCSSDFFQSEYYSNENPYKVEDNATGDLIAEAYRTSIFHMWEEQFDHSKNETLSFYKPTKILFDGLNMVHSSIDGYFINQEGETVMFDSGIFNNTKATLLVEKQSLLTFLSEKGLSLLWDVRLRKEILAGFQYKKDYPGRFNMKGIFKYNDKGEIEGKTDSVIID